MAARPARDPQHTQVAALCWGKERQRQRLRPAILRRVTTNHKQQKLGALPLRLPGQTVGAVALMQPAAVQDMPPLFVENDPVCQFGPVSIRKRGRIKFHPEMPLHRHRRPERQALAATGSVRRARADMAAHQLGRQEAEEAALDWHAADRVDVVAGPEPVRISRNPRVRPSASACAAFDLDRRVRCAQPGEQVVCPLHLRPSTGGREVTVVIPLEVTDRYLAQQRIERAEQIIAHVAPARD